MSPGQTGHTTGQMGPCPRDRRDAHHRVSRQNSLCLLVFFFPNPPPEKSSWGRKFRLFLSFSENSRRLWLFPGVCSGVPEENSGKVPGKIAGKCFPNCEMLQFLGFRAPGKANLPGTLGRHWLDLVPTFRAGCFF